MKKRRSGNETSRTSAAPEVPQTLGQYLAAIRDIRRFTLREVESATGRAVSNAYLSQLEQDKIGKPSPNVLLALARVLAVPYETLMEKAGYRVPTPEEADVFRAARNNAVHNRSALPLNDLSQSEQEALVEYLAFLRSRKGGSPSR